MTDQNVTSSDDRQPGYPQSAPWTPPTASAQPQWAPPPPPAASSASIPPPPTRAPWDPNQAGAQIPPPPVGGFNPTPAPRSRYYRRGGIRGNGIYSVVAGAISILVAVISLLVEGNGHFTFLIVLPIAGLIYGIVSIASGNRRGWGIAGTVLCALALLLEAALLFG